jgi:hypothetical protein
MLTFEYRVCPDLRAQGAWEWLSLYILCMYQIENIASSSFFIVVFVYSLPRKHVYQLFPNNGHLFRLHNYGFEQTKSKSSQSQSYIATDGQSVS